MSHDLVIGPEQIHRIGEAVEQLTPWLTQGRFRLLASGNIEFSDPEPAEATRLLRGAIEEVVPAAAREQLGERSGLGWNIFFGHVVGFWLPLRRQVGFLRALEDRAALHDVRLQLHWNRGRPVPVQRRALGNEALWAGGAVGLVGGLAATRFWPADPVLALLVFGLGIVLGRVAQRVFTRRFCGDRLCRAPIGRAKTCPSCGGRAA
ncbi:MAG: hypothetical protein H6701_03055 [Myxococcales bacterium]|nr:hypothetical protein [Myxococcales bacterium]